MEGKHQKQIVTYDLLKCTLIVADFIIRNGQDGQTVGIPVGPDMSRVFAETIGTAIDLEFQRRVDDIPLAAIRHVDDVWIGADSHADVERALSRYREAIREFELDINESKTGIFAENFSFSDFWPSDIYDQIESAVQSDESRRNERLRAAFEYVFSVAVKRNDDGILRYALRHIDQNQIALSHWGIVEPFLKRVAVHFGHAIDYVTRMLVWRHLSQGDLDITSWATILASMLEKHARLGNDSEICWTIYAHHQLGMVVDERSAERIVQNCGALSLMAVLNCVNLRLLSKNIYQNALARLAGEDANGRFWPVLLEWKSRRWSDHKRINLSNDLVAKLANAQVVLYEPGARTAVFRGIQSEEFSKVFRAIESRSSMYDDEDEEEQLGMEEPENEAEGEDYYPF